jgi:hypothetical protein
VPTNRPAIGDLFDMFDFGHAQATAASVPRSRIAFRIGSKPERVPDLAR